MSGFDDTESPDARPVGPDPRPLAAAAEALIGRRGWAKRLHGARVHEHWPTIAGPALAEHVEPVRLHGGVLVVRASSPAWATQLRFLSTELLSRANAVLGEGAVTSVTVQGPGGKEPRTRR